MDFLRRRKPEEPRPRQSVSAASSVDEETLLNITTKSRIDALYALSGDSVTTERGRHTTRHTETHGAAHVSPEGGGQLPVDFTSSKQERLPSPDIPTFPTHINSSERPTLMQCLKLGREIFLNEIRRRKHANPVDSQTRQPIDANATQSGRDLLLRSLVKPCLNGLGEIVLMCSVGIKEAIIGLFVRIALMTTLYGSTNSGHDLENNWRMCLRVMAAMLIICYFILCVREMFSLLYIIIFMYWLKSVYQKYRTTDTPKVPHYLVDYISKHYTSKMDSLIAEAEYDRLMQTSYRGVRDNEMCGPRQTPSLLVRALRVLDRKCYRSEAPATRATHQVLTSFMRHVAQLLREADSRLHNATLVGIGSHFCGLRTSRLPDEMDWLLTVALGPGMRVQMDGGRSIILVEKGSPSWHLWSKVWGGGSSLLTHVQGGLYKLNH